MLSTVSLDMSFMFSLRKGRTAPRRGSDIAVSNRSGSARFTPCNIDEPDDDLLDGCSYASHPSQVGLHARAGRDANATDTGATQPGHADLSSSLLRRHLAQVGGLDDQESRVLLAVVPDVHLRTEGDRQEVARLHGHFHAGQVHDIAPSVSHGEPIRLCSC